MSDKQDLPAIELADEKRWNEFKDANTDGYGGAIVDYAQRWARLMQARMAGGQELEDIAQATADEADTDGITGFMYGAAVSTLSKCWKHGDRLNRWHNRKYGVEESNGTVNPAIVTISVGPGTTLNNDLSPEE